ncbi:MAG: SAM-dependent methyltransferase [Rickettsiales bacterium]
MALLHPTYGYYVTDAPTFGKDGDFVTAPEISSLFGETVGAWCVDAWHKLGEPKEWRLVECGPGSGVCMQDVCRAVDRFSSVAKGRSVTLVEASPSLRKIQAERLRDVPRLTHSDDLRFLVNDAVPFILFGNEFLDALPIVQYVYENGALYERGVGLRDGEFAFVRGDRPLPLSEGAIRARHPDVTNGAVIEESPAQTRLVEKIASSVRKRSGAALFIDYGYRESPLLSTLQAVRAHKKTAIFDRLGESDITALVDFGALEKIAFPVHAECGKIESQRDFLRRHGIEELAKSRRDASDAEARLRRLVDDDAMGKSFKVMERLAIFG